LSHRKPKNSFILNGLTRIIAGQNFCHLRSSRTPDGKLWRHCLVSGHKALNKIIRIRMILLFPLLFDVGQVSREQMKKMWDFVEIMCPYCGEFQQTDVDISAGSQDYWQDCQVCCCPILFELTVDDDHQFRVSVKRDDD
jgi:hypothetical protein